MRALVHGSGQMLRNEGIGMAVDHGGWLWPEGNLR